MFRNLITTSAVLAIRGKLAGQARAVFAVGFVWYSSIRALQDKHGHLASSSVRILTQAYSKEGRSACRFWRHVESRVRARMKGSSLGRIWLAIEVVRFAIVLTFW